MKHQIAKTLGVAAVALAAMAAMPATADPVADFYRGKTMTMMISSGVGGGYNAFSRTLSRHMGKHIPGNPKFINKNRVGAGGMVAANYAYNRSPRDGTVIVGINRAVPTQPLFGVKGAKYDATKFNWLGSLNNSVSVCVSWKTQKVKAKVSGSRTKITINGKKAKRKAIKMGMTCTFNYPGPGEEAKNIDCKG